MERWRIDTDFLIMWINIDMYEGVWCFIWLSNKSATRMRFRNPTSSIIYIYQHILIDCIKLWIIRKHQPFCIVSAINHYPQGDVKTQEYRTVIHQFCLKLIRIIFSYIILHYIIFKTYILICTYISSNWRLPVDGDLSLKHVRVYMFQDNWQFYAN